MIKDAALVWLDLKDVNLRYRIERENKDDAELLMFNTPEAASAYIQGKKTA